MQWMITLPKQLTNFRRTLIIKLRNPNWNDFGFNYHATATIHYKSEPLDFELYFIPINRRGNGFNQLSEAPPGEISDYVSLLREPETYKDLALHLEASDYTELLIALNELSALKHLNLIAPADLNNIAALEPFRQGVLRATRAYLSLARGYEGSYVAETCGDARVNFSFSMLLPGTNEFLRLAFEYKDHIFFEDRIHCLIGVNGVGKTQVLSGMIGSIAQRCGEMNQSSPKPHLLYPSKSPIERADRSVDLPEGFYFNRVISYCSDMSTTLPLPGKPSSFEYHIFNSADENSSSNYGESMSHLLLNILRDANSPFSQRAWEILHTSLDGLIPLDRLAIPVTRECPPEHYFTDELGDRWCFIHKISGEKRSLDIYGTVDSSRPPAIFSSIHNLPIALSSGQRAMFRFALHFLTHAEYGSLLIIDEPETYLHPNLVSDYMMLLYNILTATASAAVIATHSAYVVRELPKHCVHVLQRENDIIVSRSPYLNTLGASVSEISTAVFGDSTANAYHRKITQQLASSDLSFEQVLESYSDIFNLNMLIEINDRMENADRHD
jgi:energy-coupling factor transporter ATP-binding protein EcfA2